MSRNTRLYQKHLACQVNSRRRSQRDLLQLAAQTPSRPGASMWVRMQAALKKQMASIN